MMACKVIDKVGKVLSFLAWTGKQVQLDPTKYVHSVCSFVAPILAGSEDFFKIKLFYFWIL